MDTFTLDHCLQKIAQCFQKTQRKKILTGVYPCDQLSSVHSLIEENNRIPIALIINTDPSDKPGSHWEGIWISENTDLEQPRTCFFFDSYGRPPINDHIREFIKSSTQITTWYNQQFQSFDSVCCGEWCCVFLWCMANGCSSASFLEQFYSKNYEQNDDKVLKIFHSIFSTKQLPKKIQQICCKYSDCKLK